MIINKKQKGSALIIALLIMGILMTMALGLSNLVLRESGINSDMINSEKAYYSAEAGIESALLDLHQNADGYEIENVGISDPETGLDFEYSIKNKTKVIPYVDTTLINPAVAQGSPKQYLFNVLKLNDSVTIPLFTTNKDGQIVPVTGFRIEYFMDADLAYSWVNAGFSTQDIPILRWKVTGLKKSGIDASVTKNTTVTKKFITESIGDYIGVAVGSSEYNPSCLGTEDAVNKSINVDGINYTAKCNGGIWWCAREAYTFKIIDGALQTVKYLNDPDATSCTGTAMSISQFLSGAEKHENNYLTLTNIFNPSVLEGLSDFEKINKAKIYYRVIITNDNEYTVREYAKISSTGIQRNLRKQIEAQVKPDRFMPVFNFSLYRTDVSGEDDKESPEGFK